MVLAADADGPGQQHLTVDQHRHACCQGEEWNDQRSIIILDLLKSFLVPSIVRIG